MIHYKVYQYRFPNGMIYIGVTGTTLQERRDCGYNHNKRLKTAMREAGWRNIEKTIISEFTSREEAFAEEERLISLMKSNDPSVGYNISKGGKATYKGLKHTDEYKRRMSESNKGKVFSDETLKRMRRSHDAERKAVFCTETDGTETKYDSLGDAAESVSGFKSNISRACLSGKQYKGFSWRFAEERG